MRGSPDLYQGRYLEDILGYSNCQFLASFLDWKDRDIPCAAMLVMCARGVLAVPGAALTISPFRPNESIRELLTPKERHGEQNYRTKSGSMPAMHQQGPLLR